MTSLATKNWQISYGATNDRLNDFYIPALEASVLFDRTTGFFSSAALAIAVAGIMRLIENGGKMRLLCGAQLSVEDVEAVDRGVNPSEGTRNTIRARNRSRIVPQPRRDAEIYVEH